jgi:succinate dehydrogenase iron-sulfur subunit
VATMRNELFGSCTNHGECEAVCPKQIPLEFIARMNRDLMRALWHAHREPLVTPGVVPMPFAEDSHEHFGEHVHAKHEQPTYQHLPEQHHEDAPTASRENAVISQ